MLYVLQKINSVLWSGPLLVLLAGTHIVLTVRSNLIQRKVLSGIRTSVKGKASFAVLATNLAATLGTGNIIGVSTAIALGGPGALFWCIITGVFGMATTYYEGYYGAMYRTSTGGGPMYIMKNVLHKPGIAAFYSFCMLLVCIGTGCLTQSNAVADSFRSAFGVSSAITGMSMAVIVGCVIIGGRKSIMKVCTGIIPVMCILFLSACIYLLVINYNYIPDSIVLVLESAFGFNHGADGSMYMSVNNIAGNVLGGIIGGNIITASRYGIARGLFTNEAGLGSAAVFAGAGNDEPHEQGMISMTATFFDTIIICTITGLVIISSYLADTSSIEGYSIGGYMNAAFSHIPYIGEPLLSLAIAGFAISTIIGWFFAGEQAALFLFTRRYEAVIKIIRAVYVIMVYLGAAAALNIIWEIADIFNVLLIIPNVLMLLRLTGNKAANAQNGIKRPGSIEYINNRDWQS